MNHFFALSLPEDVQEYIAFNITRWWREAMGEDFAPQWYEPWDYHITLKFLGDTANRDLLPLAAAAARIAETTAPFVLTLSMPGTFPNDDSFFARVFWMGVTKSTALSVLVRALEYAAAEQGWARDMRPYKPHITLVRRRRSNGSIDTDVDMCGLEMPTWHVSSFSLMQTLPIEKDANGRRIRYNIAQTFPFGLAANRVK